MLFSVDVLSTPRRELAPPIEEDEEQDSESQRGAPLRQIENNISALLRGDIPIVSRVDIAPVRRPSGFRAGVHKSESAKEMLLSQNMFGPLPPSPPTSSPDVSKNALFIMVFRFVWFFFFALFGFLSILIICFY